MFTPQELTAEHARAMRIVKAVLAACDARAATARAARAEGLGKGDAPWVLAIGKAAIGMAEGMKDVCGEPRRHLIVTVDGPAAGSLTNVVRSDHPLPTRRSLDAGVAVRRFIEDAKTAGAPSLTVLMSGGASSLICEPIPGLELEEYRAVVEAMLADGWDIGHMNAVRRSIDNLKGGQLAALADPLPTDLLLVSDVMGDKLDDIGSGPFVRSSTSSDCARALLQKRFGDLHAAALVALTCQPGPSPVRPPRRAVVALNNQSAVMAAKEAAVSQGLRVVDADRQDPALARKGVSEGAALILQGASQGEAVVWGGEWDVPTATPGFGGRAQALAIQFRRPINSVPVVGLCFATDGVDGRAPAGAPSAAGALVWTAMFWSAEEVATLAESCPALADAVRARDAGEDYEAVYDWLDANSYHRFAHRDAHRPIGEPPAQIFTGPTGTNVNDLLIAWRVK